MGRLDDYISSLEGKENIDPVVIASTMLELHNEEIATANAQIAELTEQNSAKDSVIAEKDTEITKQMAANWRLANNIPAAPGTQQGNNDEPEGPEKVGFDKFFQED